MKIFFKILSVILVISILLPCFFGNVDAKELNYAKTGLKATLAKNTDSSKKNLNNDPSKPTVAKEDNTSKKNKPVIEPATPTYDLPEMNSSTYSSSSTESVDSTLQENLYVFEAEDSANTLEGEAIISPQYGCVKWIGSGPTWPGYGWGTLQFNNVNVSNSGSYSADIWYYTAEARSAYYSVNGGVSTQINFPSTGSWNTTAGKVTQTIYLNAGNNTIKFYNNNGGAPNFDKMTVNRIFEAEDSANTLEGEAIISPQYGCVKWIGSGPTWPGCGWGTLQFNNVDVSNSGSYSVDIWYYTAEARSAYYSVNGGVSTQINFPSTGSWDTTVGKVTQTIYLNAGNNTIKFYNYNSQAPNLDKIIVKGMGNDVYGHNQDESFEDYRPNIIALPNNDVLFNDTNTTWKYIGRDVKELLNIICSDPNLANGDLNAHQQMPEVKFWNTKILTNRHLTLTSQQLEFLYYIDPDGVIDYLTFCTDDNVTYRSASLRNEVYKRLTGKEIEYYKKTIFGWEPTDKTSGDGVWSNADMALTWNRPISLADIATLGIAVGTILIALPEVAMFIEGVQAFGFYNALTAYSYGVLGSQLASWRFLTQLQNRGDISDYGIEHIFFGTVFKGKASGYHYEGISSNATIEAGTISEVDAYGVYRGKVLVDGIVKKTNGGFSTFFPKNWTPQQVVNAIKEAFVNKQLITGSTNMYQGVTNSGMKIELMLDQNGLIKSAYPLYNP